MKLFAYILIFLCMIMQYVISEELNIKNLFAVSFIEKDQGSYLVELNILKDINIVGGESADISIRDGNNKIILDHDMVLYKNPRVGRYYGVTLLSKDLLLRTEISISFEYKNNEYVFYLKATENEHAKVIPVMSLVTKKEP